MNSRLPVPLQLVSEGKFAHLFHDRLRLIDSRSLVPLAGAYSNPRVQEEIRRLHELIFHNEDSLAAGDQESPTAP